LGTLHYSDIGDNITIDPYVISTQFHILHNSKYMYADRGSFNFHIHDGGFDIFQKLVLQYSRNSIQYSHSLNI
jgi:hypothetical protein